MIFRESGKEPLHPHWEDETISRSSAIESFVKSTLEEDRDYNSMTEFHISGGDMGSLNQARNYGSVRKIEVFYNGNDVQKIKATFDRGLEIFISGGALEDLLVGEE